MAGRVYDYSRLRGTAGRLVTRFGDDAVLRRFDKAAGQDQEWPTRIVLGDYSDRQIDGTLVLMGDFIAYIAASEIDQEPKSGDRLFWGGRERTVVRVKQTKPGSTAILYECQMRGLR